MEERQRNRHSKESTAEGAASSHDPQSQFQQAKKKICNQSQKRCRNRSRKNQGIAHKRHPAKNKSPQPSRADGRRDRSNSNGDDSCSANTSEDHSQGQREPHSIENLRRRHTHSLRGFEDCRINSRKADISVAQNGQNRIENQRNNSRALANTADKGNRDQESKKRQAWNRLKNVRDSDRNSPQRRPVYDEHP